MSAYDFEVSSDKINTLSSMIDNLTQDLKEEYMKVFGNDPNVQDAIQDLYNFSLYRYTSRGLVKSLKVDLNDFDDLAMEALDDFMEEKGIEVDSTLGYLNKRVENYLLCSEDDFTTMFVLCTNFKEEIVDTYNKTLSEEEKLEIINHIKQARQFDGLVVNCDEVGVLKVMDM